MTADYNLVCMDWTEIALDVSYFTARLRCKMIGNYVAELITMLTDYTSQTTDDIHILGFSLGAHIAGYAGKRLNGQVHRITGKKSIRTFVLFQSPLPPKTTVRMVLAISFRCYKRVCSNRRRNNETVERI